MIFFSKKLIFVHIPRTGGTNIEKNLWKFEFNKDFTFSMSDEKHLLQGFVDKYRNKYQSDGLQHLTFNNIKKIYPKESKEFFKFSFIRNPFSRIASVYCEVMYNRKDLRDFLVIYKDTSFKNFLRLIKKNHHTHWMPMNKFFVHNDLDFIGRFESFSFDLNRLGTLINTEFSNKNFSANTNFSKKGNYLNFYEDKDNIELVSEIYQDDLKRFDYNFDKFANFEKKDKKTYSLKPNVKLADKEKRVIRFVKRYIKKKLYLLNKNSEF